MRNVNWLALLAMSLLIASVVMALLSFDLRTTTVSIVLALAGIGCAILVMVDKMPNPQQNRN